MGRPLVQTPTEVSQKVQSCMLSCSDHPRPRSDVGHVSQKRRGKAIQKESLSEEPEKLAINYSPDDLDEMTADYALKRLSSVISLRTNQTRIPTRQCL